MKYKNYQTVLLIIIVLFFGFIEQFSMDGEGGRIPVTPSCFTHIFRTAAAHAGASQYSPQKNSFSVKIKNNVIPYSVFGVYVLPLEKLNLEIIPGSPEQKTVLTITAGKIINPEKNGWIWEAPPLPGLYPINIAEQLSGENMTLNIFVMYPHKSLTGEFLNGYRIGSYPPYKSELPAIYKPPNGFIEVTEENKDISVSPHFTLGQFVCKQTSGYPKFLILKEKLLIKLEVILEAINANGIECSSFQIMSGYRTPYYNYTIGNVKYSRHLWGGAADIFIDENPKDDVMDDLNKDGRIDYRDAVVLFKVVDQLYGAKFYEPFIGGLAYYKKTKNHGPFVHVDVRGYHARWGD